MTVATRCKAAGAATTLMKARVDTLTGGADRIDLRGRRSVGSFNNLKITRSSGDAVNDPGNGDQITLTGVQAGVLEDSDFLF